MSSCLTSQAFHDLLDRLGDDLDTWTVAERMAAEALLADSADARAALFRARELRRLLRQAAGEPASAPPGFAGRVAATAFAMDAPEAEPMDAELMVAASSG